MRITEDQKIAGVPAVALRAFFRKERARSWTSVHLKTSLGLPDRDEARVLADLIAGGWIEEADLDGELPRFRATQEGCRLILATARKPISRATADRLITELIARAECFNREDHPLWVEELGVFGSYLTEIERLSDVDIAFRIAPRSKDAKVQDRNEQAYSDKAEKDGRIFRSEISKLFWPQRAVFLSLKGTSKSLSLHTYQELAKLNIEARSIYKRR
jgi:hypothetical protein